MAMMVLNNVTLVMMLVMFSHATMNKKYIRDDVIINARPNDHILFLSFMPRSMLIRNSKTHMAHGLKPSNKPIIMVTKGIARFFKFILPIKGIFTILLFFSSFIKSSMLSLVLLFISSLGNSIFPIYSPTMSLYPVLEYTSIISTNSFLVFSSL